MVDVEEGGEVECNCDSILRTVPGCFDHRNGDQDNYDGDGDGDGDGGGADQAGEQDSLNCGIYLTAPT